MGSDKRALVLIDKGMKNVYLLVYIIMFVGCTSSSDNVVKPNLLVIMADSLSYIDIGDRKSTRLNSSH